MRNPKTASFSVHIFVPTNTVVNPYYCMELNSSLVDATPRTTCCSSGGVPSVRLHLDIKSTCADHHRHATLRQHILVTGGPPSAGVEAPPGGRVLQARAHVGRGARFDLDMTAFFVKPG